MLQRRNTLEKKGENISSIVSQILRKEERSFEEISILENFISKIKFFHDSAPKEEGGARQFFRMCSEKFLYEYHSQGNPLFHSGDPGEKYYFILSGQVNVYVPKHEIDIFKERELRKNKNYKQDPLIAREEKFLLEIKERRMDYINDGVVTFKKINTLSKGSYFGDISLILSKPRSATVIATQNLEVITLTKANYELIFLQSIYKFNEKIDLFKNHFLDQSLLQITLFSYIFKEKTINYKETLFEEGQENDFIYFIAGGEVKMYKRFNEKTKYVEMDQMVKKKIKYNMIKRTVLVSILIAGEFLGEEVVIDQPKRSYTAIVSSIDGLKVYWCDCSTFLNQTQSLRPLIDQMIESCNMKKLWFEQAFLKKTNLMSKKHYMEGNSFEASTEEGLNSKSTCKMENSARELSPKMKNSQTEKDFGLKAEDSPKLPQINSELNKFFTRKVPGVPMFIMREALFRGKTKQKKAKIVTTESIYDFLPSHTIKRSQSPSVRYEALQQLSDKYTDRKLRQLKTPPAFNFVLGETEVDPEKVAKKRREIFLIIKNKHLGKFNFMSKFQVDLFGEKPEEKETEANNHPQEESPLHQKSDHVEEEAAVAAAADKIQEEPVEGAKKTKADREYARTMLKRNLRNLMEEIKQDPTLDELAKTPYFRFLKKGGRFYSPQRKELKFT